MKERKSGLTELLTQEFRQFFFALKKQLGRGVKESTLLTALKDTNLKIYRKYIAHVENYPTISSQERWSIFRGEVGECQTPGCQNYTKWKRPKYLRYCSKQCAGPNTVAGRKATCLAKYGVEYPTQHEDIKKKMSKGLRQSYAAKGHARQRKGKFEFVSPKIRPDTGTQFYVYVLLDPRKPSDYRYGNWKFAYEPIYVGKGKGDRAFDHLRNFDLVNESNPKKKNKIRSIINAGFEPIVEVKRKNLSEAEAYELEAKLIHLVGRGKFGPLTNCSSGGEGASGYTHSKKTREYLSNLARVQHASMSEAARKARGAKISATKRSSNIGHV